MSSGLLLAYTLYQLHLYKTSLIFSPLYPILVKEKQFELRRFLLVAFLDITLGS